MKFFFFYLNIFNWNNLKSQILILFKNNLGQIQFKLEF